jgi:hypothetical protein
VAVAGEARAERNLRDRQFPIGEKRLRLFDATLKDVTIWRQSGAFLEGANEPIDVHPEYLGQFLKRQIRFQMVVGVGCVRRTRRICSGAF